MIRLCVFLSVINLYDKIVCVLSVIVSLEWCWCTTLDCTVEGCLDERFVYTCGCRSVTVEENVYILLIRPSFKPAMSGLCRE